MSTAVEANIKGKKHLVECAAGDTFGAMKARLEEVTGFAPASMRVICQGKIRKDDEMVADVAARKKTKVLKAAVTIKPVDPDAAQRADAALRAVRSAPEEKQAAAAAAPVAKKKDPLAAAREGADGLEAATGQLVADYQEADQSGTLGGVRSALKNRAKRLQETITGTLCGLDAIEPTPETRPVRKGLVKQLLSLSERINDLNIA